MTELIEVAKSWFLGLGAKYSVNPIIFGSIYIGAIPFFLASVAWLIRNYRKERSIVLPSLSAVVSFISAYLYLIVEGNNIPWWVYGIVAGIVGYGAWSTYRKVCAKIDNKNQKKIPVDG